MIKLLKAPTIRTKLHSIRPATNGKFVAHWSGAYDRLMEIRMSPGVTYSNAWFENGRWHCVMRF